MIILICFDLKAFNSIPYCVIIFLQKLRRFAMKYNEWLDIWLENYIRPTSKIRTYELYKKVVDKRLKPKFGACEIGDVSPIILQCYITELLRSGNEKTGNALSVNSVNGIITVIQGSLKLAFDLGVADKYIADRIRRPKASETKISCFTLVEQKKIEQAGLNDKKSNMFGVVLCLYTGLRIGELLAMTWGDIDFSSGMLFVNKTAHDGKDENGRCCKIVGTPKTRSSIRSIPLPKQLVPLLKKIQTESNSEYVVSRNGKGISIRVYQRKFSELLGKLRISRKGFHALRHTFATRALECGMDVKTLSEVLGHKSATITLNRYVHSMLNYKKEMMNRIGKLL